MEEYEGMGFDENNYSLIPPVSRVTSQTGIQDQHQHQNRKMNNF